MIKKLVLKFFVLFTVLFSFSVFMTSCDSWMEDDDFYEDIDREVKVANAPQIQVYVRYAATKMGKTNPDGYDTFKVEIEHEISATTETDYGFKKWAAFPTSFIVPGDTQYTDFLYVDDKDYAEKYGKNELGDDVVHFADIYSPETTATVMQERNDIYIVPVVARRPTVALTIPSGGSSNIVRNMTARISFTKPMNPDSFKNSSGIVDKITISQGTQSISADGDIDINSEDITDHFAEPVFSKNGKMITLKFNEDFLAEGYTAQSYVSIDISREVTDIYGYAMADDYKLSFQVGSSFDTLAPRITDFTAGVGEHFTDFSGFYKDQNMHTTLGSYTTFPSDVGAPQALPSSLDEAYYSGHVIDQRMKDKITIRVFAEDIAGSGSGRDQMGVESDVTQIGIRATRLFDMDGNAVSGEENAIPISSNAYVPQSNGSELEASYTDLMNAENTRRQADGLSTFDAGKGCLYTYDLSSLEDGLIRIDIAAVDAVGNSGFADGGNYSAEYGNGYATIFVVKDNLKPDASAQASNITSSSGAAIYGWYNLSTYNTITVTQTASLVKDAGHQKLACPPADLKWIIKATPDTSWVSGLTAESEEWKLISEGWALGNFTPPSTDGALGITYAIIDDLGNISNGGTISSIMYDCTAPVFGSSSWVNSSDTAQKNITNQNVVPAEVFLKLPFTEATSGVKKISIAVNGVAVTPDYYYGNTSTQWTCSGGIFDEAKNTGNLYVQNIPLGNQDGDYSVSVKLTDQALNTSSEYTTKFSRDTAAPVINSVEVVGIQGNFVPNGNVTVKINAVETGAGIDTITFADDASPTAGSQVYFGSLSSSPVAATISSNTITLTNKDKTGTNGADCDIYVTNVSLSKEEGSGNKITITLKDYADTTGASVSREGVIKDGTAPTVSSVQMKYENINSTVYTNDKNVKFIINNANDALSGLKKLKFTGATVTATGSDTYDVLSPNSSFTIPVTITDATNGLRTVSVNAYDLVGNESTGSSASIILDTVIPTVGAMSWDVGSTGQQSGIFTGTTMEQALVIPFTEATAGVNKITIDVTMPNGVSYIGNTNLTITDGTNTLTNNTDYTISGNTITLNSPKTSGTLKISGIKVANTATEGTYTFKVKLTDAAGNEMSTPATLTANNDSTAPEITKLYVPGIVKVGGDYYISKDYAYDNKANPIEIELTVKENNTGVNKIVFDTTYSINFSKATVTLNGSTVPISSADNNTKTITISPENAINKNGTNDSFTIKIEGVCIFTGSYVKNREIKLKVYDVAGNFNENSYGKIESDGDGIAVTNTLSKVCYDTTTPSIREFKLTDRSTSGQKAQNGFTNEQYVNLKIELNSSTGSRCPVYKITLDGATFDSTTGGVKNGSNSQNVINDNLIISDDGKSLSIKSGDGYAEMANGSGLDKNTITINNVKLNSATEGAHTVKVTVTNACQYTDEGTYNITLDKTPPAWNNTNPLYSNYNSSYASKIYPTPQASSKAYGVLVNSNQYFYTAFKDGSDTTESCYVAGDCTDSNLLGFTTSGTTLSDGNAAIKLTAGSTAYNIIAVDKAGNVSEPKVCYVKAENSKESINVSELYNRITLVKPDASADVYRMDKFTDTTLKSESIKYQEGSNTLFNIYSYKTVIKSTANNYVIKVKMGSGLTASDKKIFGGSVTPTSSSFTNYNPTTTHSPVTAYTVTHYYGHWADSSEAENQRLFEPRFPDETYNFNLKEYFNSTQSYGWFDDYSLTAYCTWHDMNKHSNGSDSNVNVDDQIYSYVDENGDINIKIPTTGKIPPLTLLLKNGTGQLNYVYLTELSSGRTLPNAWNDVTTWEVDNKLGGAEVDDRGKTRSRSIVMNPINTEGDGEIWGNYEYAWGNQASSTAYESGNDGNSKTGLAVKNKVNKTTYYTNGVKLGLFIAKDSSRGEPESITFSGITGNRSDPATQAQIAAGEYTARAKLYCSRTAAPPDYSMIIEASEDKGEVTPWCYVRTKSGEGTIFFMDYPHPHYSDGTQTPKVSWDSKTPYYIFYLVEDRVGNYEIQTVVNSHSDTEMVKWLYDAEGPKVTVGETGLPPDDSSISINQLIPNHNGYQAYEYSTNGSTRNVVIGWPDSSNRPRQGAPLNNTERAGTTRSVAGDLTREYCPFFDIKVTDNSGIRAFAYSKTSVVPAFTFGSAQQGEGIWFAGSSDYNNGFGMDTEIGATVQCPQYILYNKYDAGSGYTGKYSGTAVCSVFPNDYDNTPLYLHVMDWVGNVSTYRMGANINWKKDTDKPIINTTQFEEFAEQYYINSKVGILEFAGKKVNGQTTAKVYLPSGCYTDSGTAIFGWSLEKNNVATVDTDENGSYIQLDLSKYGETPSLENVYIYDSVGNCLENSYNVNIDSTAPTYDLYVRAHDSSDAQTDNVYIKGQGYGTDLGSAVNKQLKGEDGKTKIYSNLVTSESAIQERSYYVYVSDPKICFIAKTDELTSENSVKYEILKWNGTSWVTKESETGNSTMGPRNSFYFEPLNVSSPKITVNNTGAGYYCIALSDRAGNTNYAYVYAKQDITPPAVETICTNVNTISSTNYYGPYGSVKYKVTQYDSGIYQINNEAPLSTYTTEVGPRDYDGSLSSSTYSVVVSNNNRKGETVNLKWNSVSNWSYDYSTPSCGSISSAKQYLKNNNYSGADRNIDGVSVTRNPGAQFSSILISQTDASRTSRINASGVSSFTISNVSTFVGSSDAKGWKVVIGNSSTAPTKPDFVNWNDVDVGKNGTSYTFSNFTDKTYYFYPINYAGTVGDPIKFTFETPIVPEISLGELTGMYYNNSPAFLGTTNGTAAYIGTSNSKFKVNVKNPSNTTGINIKGYYLYIKSFNSSDYRSLEMCDVLDIPIASKGNETIEISFELRDEHGVERDYLFGELCVQILTENTVTELKSLGYFMKNNVINDSISIHTAKFNNTDSGYGYFSYSYGYHNIYYGNNTDTIELNFKCDERIPCPVVGYSLDQSTWTDTNTITINRGTCFESIYTVYAKDMIGNIGSIDLKFFEDAENPVISSLTSSTANTVYDSTNNKFYSKESSIEVKVNTSDTDISYFTNGSTQNQDGIFTLSSSGEYTFYAVDKVGNSSSAYTIEYIKDTTAPTVPATYTFTPGFALDGTTVTGKDVNIGITDSPVLAYSTAHINQLKIAVPAAADLTDSGIGVSSSYISYSTDGGTTKTPVSVTDGNVIVSLSGSSAQNVTYTFYVNDKLNNTASIGSITVKAWSEVPTTPNTVAPSYSGLKAVPQYNGNDILAINATSSNVNNSLYRKVTGSVSEIIHTDSTNIYLGSATQGNPNGYSIKSVESDTKLQIPLKKSSVVGGKVRYAMTYSDVTPPSDSSYSEYMEFGSFMNGVTDEENGAVLITIEHDKIPRLHTFIFVWFKDMFGNVSVYNIAYPEELNGGNVYKNWWGTPQLQNATEPLSYIYGNYTVNGETYVDSYLLTPNTSGGPSSNKFIQMGVKVRDKITSTFNKNKSSAPKEKKVNLSNKTSSDVTAVVGKSGLQKKNSVTEKSVKTDNVIEEKVTKSRKTRKSALQGKITDSAVAVNNKSSLADEKEVMEAASFDSLGERTLVISEKDNSEVEFVPYTVEKSSAQKDYTKVIYIILTCVMACVITLVVFVNKKIVDKTKN